MKLLEKILVPVDLRPGTLDVVNAAAVAAAKFHSQLYLLHVLPARHELCLDADEVLQLAREKALAGLTELARRALDLGAQVAETAITYGVPFDQIIAKADELDVNVVVMGAGKTGRDGRPRWGISAERACRKANKPVWLVRPGGEPAIRSIVAAVDFSRASQRALANAIHLARRFNAELAVVSVSPPVSPLYSFIGWEDDRVRKQAAERHERRFTEFLQQFDFFGVPTRKILYLGDPATEILEAVRQFEADLLVMGSVGATVSSRILLGGVAERVFQAVPCSIVAFKTEDAIRLRLDDQLADIDTHFQRGKALLEHGFPAEARRQYQCCVNANAMFAPAWEGLAECYQRLQEPLEADDCRNRAEQILYHLARRRRELEEGPAAACAKEVPLPARDAAALAGSTLAAACAAGTAGNEFQAAESIVATPANSLASTAIERSSV